MDSIRGEHIAIGSELLLGQIANAHARTISLAFAEQGFFMYRHTTVGDNLGRIVEAFAQAAQRANVIVVTGGLGPTADDLTREALAEHLGRSLREDEQALHDIESYFSKSRRPMPLENRKQALVMDGGQLLPNPNGTAPGQYIEAGGVHYFLLPGPPLEMKPMLFHDVIPTLRTLLPANKVLVSRVLHLCGIGESAVDEQIPDLLASTNPTVAPLASEGEMLLRITASADNHSAAQALIEPVERRLRTMFPEFIYGVDEETLASAVGVALSRKGQTLAVAESCTGGLFSSMITAVPGASSYFLGGAVTYDNRIKQRVLGVTQETLQENGAVSEETAKAMANGVRVLCNATYGVATTGIAGPGGGTPEKPVGLVYVAIAGPDTTAVYRLQLRGSREQIRLRAVKQALWRLWSVIQTGT